MNAKEKYAKYKKSRTPKLTSTAKYTLGARYSTKGLSANTKMNMFMHMMMACEDYAMKERVEV